MITTLVPPRRELLHQRNPKKMTLFSSILKRSKFIIPNLGKYDRTMDPYEDIANYQLAMCLQEAYEVLAWLSS